MVGDWSIVGPTTRINTRRHPTWNRQSDGHEGGRIVVFRGTGGTRFFLLIFKLVRERI